MASSKLLLTHSAWLANRIKSVTILLVALLCLSGCQLNPQQHATAPSICANYLAPLGCASGLYRLQDAERVLRHHQGVDIATSPGTPVFAASGGQVLRIGQDSCIGGFIIVESQVLRASGYWAALLAPTPRPHKLHYYHLDVADALHVGQVVEQGLRLGVVSTPWQHTACRGAVPHVHLQIGANGRSSNPHLYAESGVLRPCDESADAQASIKYKDRLRPLLRC